jgi:hypothetical protein
VTAFITTTFTRQRSEPLTVTRRRFQSRITTPSRTTRLRRPASIENA